MPTTRPFADYLPEPPGHLLETHALVGKPLATALLRELARREAAVALRRRCDPGSHGFGRIVECGDEAIAIDIDDARAPGHDGGHGCGLDDVGAMPPPATDGEDYVAVAYLDGVKVQFDACLRDTGSDAGRRRLRGSPPLAVYRLQRRDAYRVATDPGQGRCVLRRGPGDELALEIVDLSARGLRLAWQGTTRPVVGSLWEHSRIEFAGRPPIPCTLVASRMDEVDDAILVACEFGPLPPEVERAVQVLVNDLQLAPRRGH